MLNLKGTTMTLKEMTRTRSLKTGTFVVEFNTPGIGHVLKAAGCDFAFLDTEHSGFGMDALKAALRYMEAAALPTIVRVPSGEAHHVNRALDAGAEGIMVPKAESVADVKALIAASKYPPAGERGVALGIQHDRFTAGTVDDKFSAANARTVLAVLVETQGAADDIDAIAAIPDIDLLWIGHFDLSVSLGIPGEFDHPAFKDAVARTEAAARRHGKSLGRLIMDPAAAPPLFAAGVDFFCYSGDAWLLQSAFRDGAATIRGACIGDVPRDQ